MNINKVIKVLIATELFLNAGWGLLSPVFAIFILQSIQGGGAEVAGFAATTYWIVKSCLQVPIGRYFDKNHGEKDDFLFMVAGLFLSGFVPFAYLLASLPWHVYLLQTINAVGMAMFVPSSHAIFSRHIDKGQEAFEWSLQSTSLGLGAGIAGAIGGILVVFFGFKMIFILVGILTFVSGFLALLIYRNIIPKDKGFPVVPPLEPRL